MFLTTPQWSFVPWCAICSSPPIQILVDQIGDQNLSKLLTMIFWSPIWSPIWSANSILVSKKDFWSPIWSAKLVFGHQFGQQNDLVTNLLTNLVTNFATKLWSPIWSAKNVFGHQFGQQRIWSPVDLVSKTVLVINLVTNLVTKICGHHFGQQSGSGIAKIA